LKIFFVPQHLDRANGEESWWKKIKNWIKKNWKRICFSTIHKIDRLQMFHLSNEIEILLIDCQLITQQWNHQFFFSSSSLYFTLPHNHEIKSSILKNIVEKRWDTRYFILFNFQLVAQFIRNFSLQNFPDCAEKIFTVYVRHVYWKKCTLF
jgi:hypothetical protein